jgi:hypothetical protein
MQSMRVVFTQADVLVDDLPGTVRVVKVVGRPESAIVRVPVLLVVPVPTPVAVPVPVPLAVPVFVGPDFTDVVVAEQAATLVAVDVVPSIEQRELVCEHVVPHDAHSLLAVLAQVIMQLETVTYVLQVELEVPVPV